MHPVTSAVEQVAALEQLAERHLVPGAGAQVCWRRFGRGPALVLLHGGHGSWLHWVRNIEDLAAQHTVWVPDMPGYGESGDAPAPVLDALLAALGESMDNLLAPSQPLQMAGFSFGGLVAVRLAERRPWVRRLALLGSAGHAGPRRPHGELRNWKAEAASGDPQRLAAVMRHNLAVHMLHGPAQDIGPLALHVHTWSCLRTRFRSKDVARSSDVRGLLDWLPAELLMAWGAHDVTADPAWLVRHPPTDRTTPHIIDAAGHWVQYERATEVNAMLLDWLATTIPARSS